MSYSFPPKVLGADLIVLLLLNCHLTGENHSFPASPHPSYTPCPWSSCGKFLIKISGQEVGGRGQGWFPAARVTGRVGGHRSVE